MSGQRGQSGNVLAGFKFCLISCFFEQSLKNLGLASMALALVIYRTQDVESLQGHKYNITPDFDEDAWSLCKTT